MSEFKKLLNTKEAAEYLGLAEQTLHNYRFNRKPPSYVKLNRRILYEQAVLDRFIESNRIKLGA